MADHKGARGGLTLGALLLNKCGRTPAQLARETGETLAAIYKWLDGSRRPTKAKRERLYELYGVPVVAWSRLASSQSASTIDMLVSQLGPKSLDIPKDKVTDDPFEIDTPAEVVPARETPGRTVTPAAGVVDDSPAGVRSEAARLLAQVQTERDKIERDAFMTVSERVKALAGCAAILTTAARLTGAAADIPEAKILKLPAWQRIERLVVETLTPWPDALAALGEALGKAAQE